MPRKPRTVRMASANKVDADADQGGQEHEHSQDRYPTRYQLRLRDAGAAHAASVAPAATGGCPEKHFEHCQQDSEIPRIEGKSALPAGKKKVMKAAEAFRDGKAETVKSAATAQPTKAAEAKIISKAGVPVIPSAVSRVQLGEKKKMLGEFRTSKKNAKTNDSRKGNTMTSKEEKKKLLETATPLGTPPGADHQEKKKEKKGKPLELLLSPSTPPSIRASFAKMEAKFKEEENKLIEKIKKIRAAEKAAKAAKEAAEEETAHQPTPPVKSLKEGRLIPVEEPRVNVARTANVASPVADVAPAANVESENNVVILQGLRIQYNRPGQSPKEAARVLLMEHHGCPIQLEDVLKVEIAKYHQAHITLKKGSTSLAGVVASIRSGPQTGLASWLKTDAAGYEERLLNLKNKKAIKDYFLNNNRFYEVQLREKGPYQRLNEPVLLFLERDN